MSVTIAPTRPSLLAAETSREALNPKKVPAGYVTDKMALTERKRVRE